MNVWTWKECCNEACQQLNRLGMEQATHHCTVRDWNNEFRTQGNFSHPNHSVRCGKHPMPPLFVKYPKAMDDIIAFGVKNLTVLTVEVVHSFCHDQLIPKLLLQWQDGMITCKSLRSDRDLLTRECSKENTASPPLVVPPGCWRSLHQLGFTYDVQRRASMLMLMNEVMSLQLTKKNSVRCTYLNLNLDVGDGCNPRKTNWKHVPN
jgi:hypothetical protein